MLLYGGAFPNPGGQYRWQAVLSWLKTKYNYNH